MADNAFVEGSNFLRKDWRHIEVYQAAMGIERVEEAGRVYLRSRNWEWTCNELDRAQREYERLGNVERVKRQMAMKTREE
ncbi:MAG: hypothetical protein Q4D04_14520 [Clostridia bacterium]|nr:hypothetical protein [Clostridia bacterium]